MKSILSPISFFLLTAAQVSAAPSISDLGTSLTILKDNDLYGQYSKRNSSAILLESFKTFESAESACSLLSEQLWSPETQLFSAGVNNSLSYQAYIRKFSYSQQFWVADYNDGNPKTKDTCRAIDLAGKVRSLDCNRLLPSLCTHTAPLSNYSFWDASEPYQVAVKAGSQTLTGFRDAYGFRFRGIRYAADPGRFQHSVLYDAVGDIQALSYSPVCIQIDKEQSVGAEDCFFLNIGTPYLPGPKSKPEDLKPVFFWIHGGASIGSSAEQGRSEGVNLVSRGDVVVVRINYRLAHFGWLSIDGTSITGNYGLGDMITALKWVRKNIAAFGGDPGRITIGGDSSGAADVRALMASEPADGLFHGAIIQSLPIGYAPTGFWSDYLTIPEATGLFGPMVIEGTGCASSSDLEACLTNADATTLNWIATPIGRVAFPVIDNILLATRTLPVTGKGYAAKVPLMIGVNRDEGSILLAPYYGITDAVEFLDGLGQYVGRDLTPLASSPAFPLSPGDPALSAFNLTQRVATDAGYKCLAWATAYSASKHNVLPAVYPYEFNRTYQPAELPSWLCSPPATPGHPFGDPDAEYFKCHDGDVDTTFGQLLFSGKDIRDEYDIPFEQLIVDYWTAFVRNQDPNPKKGYLEARGYWGTLEQITKTGKWGKFDPRRLGVRRLQWDGGMIEANEQEQCAVLGLPLDYYETAL
ncbi:Acetylcholinesterase [Dactylella cylindrospora]|nr:Acetylcholinesterase [Dactylella cylindrospora]